MARYEVEEYVRWEDIDAAGIINYQAYLRFFGLAEAEMLRACGLHYQHLFDDIGIWLPRVRVECEFYDPVRLDELLIVETYFGHLGDKSLHLNFEVKRKLDRSKTVASGKYILVAVRQGSFEPCRVPDEVRQKVAKYVEEQSSVDSRQSTADSNENTGKLTTDD